mmetsp:Transcript_108256/g.305132  ORF Transcript_108256/g.305132 Transcript_108256/m.305132 type:complete len:361 (+) Transcript_108256:512-1594(+)
MPARKVGRVANLLQGILCKDLERGDRQGRMHTKGTQRLGGCPANVGVEILDALCDARECGCRRSAHVPQRCDASLAQLVDRVPQAKPQHRDRGCSHTPEVTQGLRDRDAERDLRARVFQAARQWCHCGGGMLTEVANGADRGNCLNDFAVVEYSQQGVDGQSCVRAYSPEGVCGGNADVAARVLQAHNERGHRDGSMWAWQGGERVSGGSPKFLIVVLEALGKLGRRSRGESTEMPDRNGHRNADRSIRVRQALCKDVGARLHIIGPAFELAANLPEGFRSDLADAVVFVHVPKACHEPRYRWDSMCTELAERCHGGLPGVGVGVPETFGKRWDRQACKGAWCGAIRDFHNTYRRSCKRM